MNGIKIMGSGSYTPPKVVTNEDFTSFIDTSDEWIFSRTGIRRRHFSTEKMNFQMAAAAAQAALEDSGMKPEELDLIIASTCTPDFLYPSMSCLVQHEIGAKNAVCIDSNSACTGFITAIDMAQRYIATGDYKRVLVVASEFLTRMLDFTDRNTCYLFGDGAGAVVVEPANKDFYSVISAQGDYLKALYCKINYPGKIPLEGFNEYEKSLDEILDTEAKRVYLQMDGKAVYRFAVDAMSKSLARVCEKAGISSDELDIVIPHQANIRIINAALKTMNVPEEKVMVNIENNGNTSSACIPTILDRLNREGKLKSGMKMALVGFGAGLTSGAVIMDL